MRDHQLSISNLTTARTAALLSHIGKLTLGVLPTCCSQQSGTGTFARRAWTEESCSNVSPECSSSLPQFLPHKRSREGPTLCSGQQRFQLLYGHRQKATSIPWATALLCFSVPHQKPLPPHFIPFSTLPVAIGNFHVRLHEKDSGGSVQMINFPI